MEPQNRAGTKFTSRQGHPSFSYLVLFLPHTVFKNTTGKRIFNEKHVTDSTIMTGTVYTLYEEKILSATNGLIKVVSLW